MFGIIGKAANVALVTGFTGLRIANCGGVIGATKQFFEDCKTVALFPWTVWQNSTEAGFEYQTCLSNVKQLKTDWLFSAAAPVYGAWCEVSRMQSIIAAVVGVYVAYKVASYGLCVVQTGIKCYRGYKKVNAFRKQVFQYLTWGAQKGQSLLQSLWYRQNESDMEQDIKKLGQKYVEKVIDVKEMVTNVWEKGMELYEKAQDKNLSSTSTLPVEQLKSLLELCIPLFQHMRLKEDGLFHIEITSSVDLAQILEKFPSLPQGQQEKIQVMGPQVVLDILPPPVAKQNQDLVDKQIVMGI